MVPTLRYTPADARQGCHADSFEVRAQVGGDAARDAQHTAGVGQHAPQPPVHQNRRTLRGEVGIVDGNQIIYNKPHFGPGIRRARELARQVDTPRRVQQHHYIAMAICDAPLRRLRVGAKPAPRVLRAMHRAAQRVFQSLRVERIANHGGGQRAKRAGTDAVKSAAQEIFRAGVRRRRCGVRRQAIDRDEVASVVHDRRTCPWSRHRQ
jgi:hypothetical protein